MNQPNCDVRYSVLSDPYEILHISLSLNIIVDPGDFVWFTNLKTFQKVMDVNFFGQLRVTQALLPLFLRTSPVYGGRILNLSSVCGISSSPGNNSYTSSKFAVEAWSDALRLELALFNMKVVKIRPAQFDTSIHSDYNSRMVKNFRNAPQQVQNMYGGEDYVKNVVNKLESSNLEPANDVVDAVLGIIEMRLCSLEPYYWLGSDAHTLWKALHHLPTNVADTVKRIVLQIKTFQPTQPPANIVSHVTINVCNLQKSLPFYTAFGLKPYGEVEEQQQFLASGSSKLPWSTLVLLKEDPSMPTRGDSYEAGGIAGLYIYTTNLHKEVQRLKALGLKPVAPTAFLNSGFAMKAYVTAFKDPDGFVVRVIEFKRLIGTFVKASVWWRKKADPNLFHWTVKVTCAEKALEVFETLGFTTNGQVEYDLRPVFNMVAKTTLIEHIRMCRLPNDAFYATIMECVNPKSEKKGSGLTNSMTIAVNDVDSALELAQKAGMVIEPPEYRRLPVFGRVMVGKAYVEPGMCPIEFCCFSRQL
jgi:catechol 2,3-dioxygenase-like lactoylglutathione lyase family enzyme